MHRPDLQTQTVGVVVGPEVVVGVDQRVGFEGQPLGVTHADAEEAQGAAPEQVLFSVVRPDLVVEAGDDAGINVSSWQQKNAINVTSDVCLRLFSQTDKQNKERPKLGGSFVILFYSAVIQQMQKFKETRPIMFSWQISSKLDQVGPYTKSLFPLFKCFSSKK